MRPRRERFQVLGPVADESALSHKHILLGVCLCGTFFSNLVVYAGGNGDALHFLHAEFVALLGGPCFFGRSFFPDVFLQHVDGVSPHAVTAAMQMIFY